MTASGEGANRRGPIRAAPVQGLAAGHRGNAVGGRGRIARRAYHGSRGPAAHPPAQAGHEVRHMGSGLTPQCRNGCGPPAGFLSRAGTVARQAEPGPSRLSESGRTADGRDVRCFCRATAGKGGRPGRRGSGGGGRGRDCRLDRNPSVMVRCDDGEYGYAYDRMSHVGRLARVLSQAPQRGAACR